MIDIHSHLIHGVDDGPSNIEYSIRMVREAEKLGIKTIVATPHFHENVFEYEMIEENYQELLFMTSDYDVSLKLGYEVFVDPFDQNPIRGKKRFTLWRTNYILLEFPFNVNPSLCITAAKKIQNEGLIPIVAHLERTRNFPNCIGDLVCLIKMGCLIQVDAASIIGVYGKRIRDYSKRLIKLNLVDVIASNSHSINDYIERYPAAYKNVLSWVGKEETNRLFTQNAANILQNTIENKQESIFRVI